MIFVAFVRIFFMIGFTVVLLVVAGERDDCQTMKADFSFKIQIRAIT